MTDGAILPMQGNGELEPILDIWVDTPLANSVVPGPQPGVPLTLTGGILWDLYGSPRVAVQVDGIWYGGVIANVRNIQVGEQFAEEADWTATVRLYRSGPASILVRLTARSERNGFDDENTVTHTVNVALDSPQPDLSLLQPTDGDVPIGEAGEQLALRVRTDPNFGPRTVGWEFEGASGIADPDPADPAIRNGRIPVGPLPLGPRTITVRCTDAVGNETMRSVTITARDTTPPHLEVVEPRPYQAFVGGPDGVTIPIRGRATDAQSGMVGGSAAVEWTLTGGPPYTRASTSDNWATWQAEVSLTDFGAFTIELRCTDRDGSSQTVPLPIQVVSDYRPRELVERLAPRAYLSALLAFARDIVQTASGAQLPSSDLQAVFVQPFGRLSQPLSQIGNLGDQSVNQLQVVAEVLRQHLRDSPPLLAAHWTFAVDSIEQLPDGSASARDVSGNGHAAVLVGNPELIDGPGGRAALEFDGTSSFAQVDGGSALQLGRDNADFSVSFFLCPRSGPSGQFRSVLHKGAADQERTFALWLRPDDLRLHVRVSTSANANEGLDSNGTLAVGRWTHVAYVKSGGELQLYLDGQLDTRVTLGGPTSSNTGPLYIGKDPWWPGVAGAIGDVRIYTLALSQASIRGLAAAPSDPDRASAQAAAEARYRGEAYGALLAGVGTSYEELRLLRGAQPEERRAVADRLGIPLGTATPDALDQLTLDEADRTEAALEQLFGLRDTDVTKDVLRPPVSPLLLGWRGLALQQRWARQDAAPEGAERSFPVLVDPDRVGDDDLARGEAGSAPRELLEQRRRQLRDDLAELAGIREGAGSPAQAMAALLADTFPRADLPDLDARRRAGQDIGPQLAELQLPREAFSQLIRVGRLADQGTVTDVEWQDVDDILAAVRKRRRYEEWRAAEAEIALTPTFFRLADIDPPLPRWRTSAREREDWRELLRSRVEEWRSLHQAYAALLAAVEELALPWLRDALVLGTAGEPAAGDAAEWLTERLQIDVRASGSLRTTRIVQASETLQSVLFSLRAGRLPSSHPADAWSIGDEQDFDDSWRWLGEETTWRAAMEVYLFPENLLLPALRPDSTQPFRALVQDLRRRSRLTPDDARAAAARYLAPQLPQLHRSLPASTATWSLDEGAGTAVADGSGRGSPGTVAGAIWTEGQIGAALAFDGLDDVVTLAPSQALREVTNTFTLSFWAAPESPHQIDQESTTGFAGIEGQRYALGPEQGQTRYGPNHAGVGVSVGSNGVSVYEHSAGYLPPVLVHQAPVAGWTHVAVVYDDRRPRLYLNGRLVRSREQQSPQAYVHACPEALGGMAYGHFHGRLDDVRVYREPLTLEQIELLAFRITDQRTEAELEDLRRLSRRLLEPYQIGTPPWLAPGAAWLNEVFYFVPIALALQLEASGQYLAALDWFQNVYAYNLPPVRRRIHHGLTLERNLPVDLTQRGDWTRRLNPHRVAADRPNPLTRFALLSLARCCMQFADAEFAREVGDAVARARALYLTARDLLALPELEPAGYVGLEVAFPNPILTSMRARVEMQLAKLRQGRNIAGMQRTADPPPAAAEQANGGAPTPVSAPALVRRPTPYRYAVLMERARQLAGLSQQIEGAYLDALEKFDAAQYRRFDADKGVELADASVELQTLRVREAARGVSLAQAQKNRTVALAGEYQHLIDAGLNEYEENVLNGIWQAKTLRDVLGGIDSAIELSRMAMQAGDWLKLISSFGAAQGAAGVAMTGIVARAIVGGFLNAAEAQMQSDTLLASHERRVEEWQLQRAMAVQDGLIADEQVLLATDQQAIVRQEEVIARAQADQARATVAFLDRQFTNRELYEWMSGVLSGVYRYFLQQATAVARLAQDQLAFERQEPAAGIVQADYWEPPPDGAADAAGTTPRDRRGLTGSARLLEDVTRLDQYAFETDQRKLNLSQTFSLADLVPLEFQRFRDTGVLPFATPMSWFDEGFPGHYLRLIRRVRVSVVALIPPGQGIRATLTASGISRVVVAGEPFREAIIRRNPELVALTSPVSSSGVFEMDTQADMLLPFEAMGVDTTWELQLPKAANPLNFDWIANVLVTVEYTALYDPDYRRQVVERLNASRRRTGDRAFSLRRDFPDAWYELHNPPDGTGDRTVRFTLDRADFPSNLEDPRIEQVVVFLPSNDRPVPETAVTLQHAGRGGLARSNGGLISTRRGNAAAWEDLRPQPAPGDYQITFESAAESLFDDGQLQDVLFVIGYAGRVPAWPI